MDGVVAYDVVCRLVLAPAAGDAGVRTVETAVDEGVVLGEDGYR
jgi:hypothetical protein